MDSIVTCLVEGTTRTRIIDWVRTWSEVNLESSSEPRSRTVNAPLTCGRALGDGVKRSDGEAIADGEGTFTAWPVDPNAIAAAGRKYAKPPDPLARTIASRARSRIRSGFSRRCEARARRLGLPSGTGVNCSRRRGREM